MVDRVDSDLQKKENKDNLCLQIRHEVVQYVEDNYGDALDEIANRIKRDLQGRGCIVYESDIWNDLLKERL